MVMGTWTHSPFLPAGTPSTFDPWVVGGSSPAARALLAVASSNNPIRAVRLMVRSFPPEAIWPESIMGSPSFLSAGLRRGQGVAGDAYTQAQVQSPAGDDGRRFKIQRRLARKGDRAQFFVFLRRGPEHHCLFNILGRENVGDDFPVHKDGRRPLAVCCE